MSKPTITIHYPDRGTKSLIERVPFLRDCQESAIRRFLSGDLPMPSDILDHDAMRNYYDNRNRMKRGHGEVAASYFLNEEGDIFTWDMVLNADHTKLDVYVFIQWYIDTMVEI